MSDTGTCTGTRRVTCDRGRRWCSESSSDAGDTDSLAHASLSRILVSLCRYFFSNEGHRPARDSGSCVGEAWGPAGSTATVKHSTASESSVSPARHKGSTTVVEYSEFSSCVIAPATGTARTSHPATSRELVSGLQSPPAPPRPRPRHRRRSSASSGAPHACDLEP